jgi:hypothetical protein
MQEERFAWVDVKAADRSGGLHFIEASEALIGRAAGERGE